MPARPVPGLAFSLATDAGFALGVVTHDRPKIGSLVWMARPTFQEPPTETEAKSITEWRWPVFFPLTSALRRKIVTAIGLIELPPGLCDFPTMRSGNRSAGWQAFTENASGERRRLGAASDPDLPIYKVVNDTRLREMIVSGWRPRDEW